jgi:heme/copper-type cytochrome/quinol oxidase subunit 2
MDAPKNKSSSLASTIRWVARILCILAIGFIGMFALEAVEGKVGLGRQILGFLMAPPFLTAVPLIIILIIAWKRELVGGILIALFGLATALYAYIFNYHRFLALKEKGFVIRGTSAVSKSLQIGSPDLRALNIVAMISLPFIIVGVLFIISYFLHRPKKLTTQTP